MFSGLPDPGNKTSLFKSSNGRQNDSDECNVSFNPGAREQHVILEAFPHFTHYKQIYKEFRKIGIERLKVDVVSNFPPNPTLAIVTFDCDEAVEEALKWDGKDFNHQPMYIRKLDTNDRNDMEMLKVVLGDGKRNEEFNDRVRHQWPGERTVRVSNIHSRGQTHKPYRGNHRGGQRGRGQYMHRQNVNEYGYQHHMGQGDFVHPPIQPMGHRGAVHAPTPRPFMGRGGLGIKPPAPHHNHPPFGVPGASPRFRTTNPFSGHRPSHRRMVYTRGRGSFTTKQNQHSNQSKQTIDPFVPTPEDYDVSSQLQQMLNDCFPEGCKPWIAKDLPAKIEAHIAEIINERYFFAHVTNGLPGIEIKEMTRKMGDKAFIDGAEPYTDPTIRKCAALYSDNPAEQPPELFRAWIKELSEDGQCEVFFIDWGNISKQSRDNLSVIKDIHWTMRPQIVLFRMNNTSSLLRNMKVTLKVLTESVYEKNYVVPVELTDE